MSANIDRSQCDELYSRWNQAEYERNEWQKYLDTELATEHGLANHEDLSFAQASVDYWQNESVALYDAWANGNCSES